MRCSGATPGLPSTAQTTGEANQPGSITPTLGPEGADAAMSPLCLSYLASSLGLVLPPYNDFFIQADLSDVMVQLQCE